MLYPLDYLSKVYINILAKKILLEQNYFMMRFLHFLSLYKKLAQCLFFVVLMELMMSSPLSNLYEK
jgi:hypothetical protein